MKTMFEKMRKAGYVEDPNQIYPDANVWYAGSSGMLDVPTNYRIDVRHDRIRVFEIRFFGEAYTRRSYIDTVTIAVFDSVSAFLKWLQDNGIRSGGINLTRDGCPPQFARNVLADIEAIVAPLIAYAERCRAVDIPETANIAYDPEETYGRTGITVGHLLALKQLLQKDE